MTHVGPLVTRCSMATPCHSWRWAAEGWGWGAGRGGGDVGGGVMWTVLLLKMSYSAALSN